MPDLPPVIQPFRADTKQYGLACRAIAKHMTALADELAALDSPFGPLSPVLPVPVDDLGAPRPEPRRFEYRFADPCKGELRIPLTSEPAGREGNGDYTGYGWKPLGVTGFEVRIWAHSGELNGEVPAVHLQYRPLGAE